MSINLAYFFPVVLYDTLKSCSGESVTKQPLIKSMRGVKKETLNLINCWVSKSNDPKLVSVDVMYEYDLIGQIG